MREPRVTHDDATFAREGGGGCGDGDLPIESDMGVCLGDYEADDEDGAVDAMARDAGYESEAEATEVVGSRGATAGLRRRWRRLGIRHARQEQIARSLIRARLRLVERRDRDSSAHPRQSFAHQ